MTQTSNTQQMKFPIVAIVALAIGFSAGRFLQIRHELDNLWPARIVFLGEAANKIQADGILTKEFPSEFVGVLRYEIEFFENHESLISRKLNESELRAVRKAINQMIAFRQLYFQMAEQRN